MIAWVVVATLLAGAVGAVARFLAARAFAGRSRLPWGVLAVNVAGSAVGGAVLALASLGGVSGDIRTILLTGLCGGLTTFSTWSVESVQLAVAGRVRAALANVGGTLLLGIAAAAGGYALVLSSF